MKLPLPGLHWAFWGLPHRQSGTDTILSISILNASTSSWAAYFLRLAALASLEHGHKA
jgi:hypothetical protein